VCDLLKTSADGAVERVQQLIGGNRALERELEQLKGKLASAAGSDIAADAIEINGIKVLAKKVEGFNSKTLRDTVDQLKNKLGSAVVVLACVEGDKVSLVAGVTQDLTGSIKAGDLVNSVARQVGGKGGGRADMAMAGGTDITGLDAALRSVSDFVTQFT
jgi:alanyl-tRNA synthetase